jgi:hypothetical protein
MCGSGQKAAPAMMGLALAGLELLLQAAQLAASSGLASFADVYGWVYRTGKEVAVDVPAASCLGLKTPQNVYERTWLAPDAKVHAIEVSEDRNNPFVVISVRRSLDQQYAGKFWLAGKDGRLSNVCNSPHMYAAFVPVTDRSLDGEFQSEKTYFGDKFGQRWRWDRYSPVKRVYP